MNRRISALAVAVSVLAGAGLAGCGGAAETPSSAQVMAMVRAAAQEADREVPEGEVDRDAAVSKFMGLLNELRELPALDPLFARYDVAYPIVADEGGRGGALVELLGAIRIARVSGVVYVTNRATGAIVYAAPATDLGRGTLEASALPVTGAAPPPADAVTCMSFAYSTWSSCRPDGTVTRTVLASSPSGCSGGSPLTSRPCAYALRRLEP